MLRTALLIFGWTSLIGSIADELLLGFSLWLVITAVEPLSLSINQLLQQHLYFIYWIKQVAYYVLPNDVVVWLFNLPALWYFPIRIVVSIVIGWWALAVAAKMKQNDEMEAR